MTGRYPVILTVLAVLLLLAPAAVAQEVEPAEHPVPVFDPHAPPEVSALAVAVVDAESGILLYGLNARERRAQASLTKMTTAMVARERWSLDDPIVATERSMTEPSIIGMEPGDELPLRDALYGLILMSGNDAALAIAETIGQGSIEQFIEWMNESVAELGLEDTHFENPHGFDAPEHYSTAYDVAQISRAYLQDEVLATVARTERHEVPGPPLWVFTNIHPLVGIVEGVEGIKTGYETNAGHCLSTSMVRNGRRLIVVVLHDEHRAADTVNLLDWAFDRFRWKTVRIPDPITGRATTETVPVARDREEHLRGMVRFEWESRR